MLPSRDFWRSVCGWEKSWRNYPPQAFVILGEYRKEPQWSRGPMRKSVEWEENQALRCSRMGWVEAGIISVAEEKQRFPSQGPWWWTGSGWSCPLTESTTAPLWGDGHVDKGNWQPTESSCNDRVAVLQPCHQASDHFPPSPRFQEEDAFKPTFGFPSLQSAKKRGMKMRTAPLQVPWAASPAGEAEGEGFQSRYEFGVSRWPGLVICESDRDVLEST